MVPFNLHRRIPFIRRPFYQRDVAIAERGALLAEISALAARLAESAQREPPMPYDFDADGMKLWDKNLSALHDPKFLSACEIGLSGGPPIQYRAYVCCWAATQAAKVPGDFVECGVNEGWLSLTMCHYLDFNTLDKSFFLFDTYRGIPGEQITERERVRAALHVYPECYERTRQKFSPFPKAKLIRGLVPDTLPTVEIDKVSYLSIDMNIVKPERAAIEFFWPKLSAGGVVVLDDYAFGGYEAQHESMDEFASKVGANILTLPTGQGLIIKA
jgi:O-methyltransferase